MVGRWGGGRRGSREEGGGRGEDGWRGGWLEGRRGSGEEGGGEVRGGGEWEVGRRGRG